jgi:hypothetical protein
MGINYKPVTKNIPEDVFDEGKLNNQQFNNLDATNEEESIEKVRDVVKRSEVIKQMEAKHIEAQH